MKRQPTESMMNRYMSCARILPVILVIILLGACASYIAPSGPADLRAFGLSKKEVRSLTDRKVQAALDLKPTAMFPVTLAVVRVQEPGYCSYTARGYGRGRYSVVTTRDVETDDDFQSIRELDRVNGVATVNRLLLPRDLNDDRELRAAAAAVQADMLLLYTFDTTFNTTDGLRPLTVISLGLFPTKDVQVYTTASALLMDTRTGYIYGVAEATARRSQLANAWTDGDAADQSRRKTEREAFQKLVADFQRAWGQVVAHYDRGRPAGAAPTG